MLGDTYEDRLKFELGLEENNNYSRPDWTDDYQDGFLDGLSRALEILQEEYSSE